MKTNIIYMEDCIDVLNEKIDAGSIGLVFADPPYNLSGNGLKWKSNQTGGDWYMVNEQRDKMTPPEYMKFTRKWIGACDRVLKEKGSIYIASSYHNIAEIIIVLKQLNFKINNIITWYKTNAMPNMTKRVFTHSIEFVVWAVKGSGWTFNYDKVKEINPVKQKDGSLKQMRDLWELPLGQGKERIRGEDGRALHPTQKPEEMFVDVEFCGDIKNLIGNFSGKKLDDYICSSNNNGEEFLRARRSSNESKIKQGQKDVEMNIKKTCYLGMTDSGMNRIMAWFFTFSIRFAPRWRKK